MPSRWPASLPQYVLKAGFSQSGQETTLRSQMSQGPAKTRPRVTQSTVPIRCSTVLDPTQVAAFEDFYANDLEQGALEFEWVDHVHGTDPVRYRFTRKPTYGYWAFERWQIQMDLERMP